LSKTTVSFGGQTSKKFFRALTANLQSLTVQNYSTVGTKTVKKVKILTGVRKSGPWAVEVKENRKSRSARAAWVSLCQACQSLGKKILGDIFDCSHKKSLSLDVRHSKFKVFYVG
jgi:hypothetical protein